MSQKSNIVMQEKTRFVKIYNLFGAITDTELNMGNYPNRLMLQKLVFLLQKAGLNFGYDYSWYLKGPYSIRLTKDGFDFFVKKQKAPKIKFNSKETMLVKKIKKSFKNEVKNDSDLELLGSLVYIKKEMLLDDPEQITAKLVSLKPWFSKENANQMLYKIEQSQLFN